jgi:dihydroorotate dehydrogenase electron transfer subunit
MRGRLFMSRLVTGKIIKNISIADNIYFLSINLESKRLNISAGNFANILCKGENETFLRRPLSVYDYNEDEITFLYKVLGKGTENLSKSRKDDKIDLIVPCGNQFLIPENGNIVLIAGGMGIAPINFLIRSFSADTSRREIYLYYGVTKEDELINTSLLERKDIKIYIHIDYTEGIFKGNLFDYFLKNEPDEYQNTFLCGPSNMIKRFSTYFLSKNKQIQISLESNMACGIGACLGCSIKTTDGMKTICKDGPIFNAEKVIFESI